MYSKIRINNQVDKKHIWIKLKEKKTLEKKRKIKFVWKVNKWKNKVYNEKLYHCIEQYSLGFLEFILEFYIKIRSWNKI